MVNSFFKLKYNKIKCISLYKEYVFSPHKTASKGLKSPVTIVADKFHFSRFTS
jgi:hypothetical protein